MKTYQDLLEVADYESLKSGFCVNAIEEFKDTKEYKEAGDGEAYYAKHNITIEEFKKFLYTVSGRKVEDVFSSNYKLKSLFFRTLVIQQVQYVLGNGLVLQDVKNKEKLGKNFDYQLQLLAKKAMAAGRAFGFWNYDHLEVFGFADTPSQPGFCPLYDEVTGELSAGIRYWYMNDGKDTVLRMTLYELDGYTEYAKREKEEYAKTLQEKTAYKQIITKTNMGIEGVQSENYNGFPIVCLFANDVHESELVGVRESIDCYDFIKSGFANAIDDTADFYWILKNTGGMDNADLAQFVQRMKTVKATVVDGDENVSVESHTINIPVEARDRMLEILKRDIYEDFQSLDVKALSAAAKTTQEIKAAYQSMDNKCADFEYLIIDFVEKILALAGIEDEPSFIWNKVVNAKEQTETIMLAAEYLTDDIVIKKLPFLTPEEADAVIAARDEMDFKRFNNEDE